MGTKAMLQRVSIASLTVLLLVGAPGIASAGKKRVLTVKPSGGGYTTIQAAIDASSAGDVISVYPGDYLEVAADRYVLGVNGPHAFGLFIDQAHGNLTIQGVDAKGRVIHDWKRVAAHLTTNSTADFGPCGIFVEGDGVTITGLDIGANLDGQNKTIEVIGDDFTLKDCDISDVWGSVYLGDWRFDDVNDVSHIQRYRIQDNNFQDGVSIDIANGAGYSGEVRYRVIQGNEFMNSYYWPSISFNGSDTGVPWFVYSVGGATIRANHFVNTLVSTDPWELEREGHIRARGTYDNSQFDWKAWWLENRYDAAFVVGPNPPKEIRDYSYLGDYGVIYNVRRIGALLEGEELHQLLPGDTILSK